MCLAIPAQVRNIDNYSAIIDIMGLESRINIQLIEELKVGDYVLVHAGCAIQKIDKDYLKNYKGYFNQYLIARKKYE